jgi:hypothetical protein
MRHRRWFVAVALAGALALGASGCGGGDSDDSSSDPSRDEPSATVDAGDDTKSEGAPAELDPETIDPCLMEPAEILALIAANPDALGQAFGDSLGAGVRNPQSPNECLYEWTSSDPGVPQSFFSLVVYAPRDGCLVEHRGVCVLPTTTYGDTPITVSPQLEQAVKARIDAQ